MPALKDLFLKHIAQTSDSPLLLEIERAEGIYLFDSANKSYIDLISGISVSSVGHSHPKIINAINEQAGKHLHLMVYGEYIQSPQVKLAKQLTQLTENLLDSVYFVNSGSEAVEGSLKLSRRYTGRKKIIACRNAYHGSTSGALSLISNKEYTSKFQSLSEEVDFINFNETGQIDLINNNTACVIIETVQGEAGYIPAHAAFLKLLRAKCTETGTLLIFDEVQCGMGRTGNFFAFQEYQVIPDILVLAKALGGGMPLGAFMAKKEIMNCLSFNPALGHITTFGGHPVSCAASLAAIRIIREEKLLEQVPEKEKLFRDLLKHHEIIKVNGKGLMLAIHLKSSQSVINCIRLCLKKGLITDWFLFCDTALRISPPLTISTEQIRAGCLIILEALDQLEK